MNFFSPITRSMATRYCLAWRIWKWLVLQCTRLPVSQEEGEHVCLKNVIWTRPITVGSQSLEVHIRLFAEGAECRGRRSLDRYEIYTRPRRRLAGDSSCMPRGWLSRFRRPSYHPWIWMRYGWQWMAACLVRISAIRPSGLWGLTMVLVSRGLTRYIWVAIGSWPNCASLHPSRVAATQYVLHPSLMDAALQASIGPILRQGTEIIGNPGVPFALEELEILGPCTAVMWALIRYAGGIHLLRRLASSMSTCVTSGGTSGCVCAGCRHGRSQVAPRLAMPRRWVRCCCNRSGVNRLRPVPRWICPGSWWCSATWSNAPPRSSSLICQALPASTGMPGTEAIDQQFQDYAAKLLEEVKRIVLAKSPEKRPGPGRDLLTHPRRPGRAAENRNPGASEESPGN